MSSVGFWVGFSVGFSVGFFCQLNCQPVLDAVLVALHDLLDAVAQLLALHQAQPVALAQADDAEVW